MIKAAVFVQSFIWAALLIRKPSKIYLSLALSFLILFFIYLLLYINTVYGRPIPLDLVPAGTMLLCISVSFFQLRKLPLRYLNNERSSAWILLAVPILLAGYCMWTGLPLTRCWTAIILLGAITFVLDTLAMIEHGRKLNYTGSILEDTPSKLGLFLLLDKLLVLLLGCIILFMPEQNEQRSGAVINSMHMLVAVLVFITGYMAATAPFQRGGQKKQRHVKLADGTTNPELIEKLTQLMEDQKPYLDSELSLVKMADMLEISENELTRLLNQEMNTNFYSLVNDYRMEKSLKNPISANTPSWPRPMKADLIPSPPFTGSSRNIRSALLKSIWLKASASPGHSPARCSRPAPRRQAGHNRSPGWPPGPRWPIRTGSISPAPSHAGWHRACR